MRTLATTVVSILFFGFYTPAQNVAINDDGSIPNSNAILDIDDSSNDKGILIPRMTTAQRTAISGLAGGDEGLTVYDENTNSYWLWDGTKWVQFLMTDTGWKLSGNAETTAGTDFIGTTDAVDLVFKTNNSEAMRIESGGNVGIGTTAPSELLHLKSTDADLDMETIGTDVSTIHYKKAKGTIGTPTIVTDGTNLGQIEFRGYDGTSYESAAIIQCYADGTASDGSDMPASMNFSVSADGSASPTESLTIRSDGFIGINDPTPSAQLDIDIDDDSYYAYVMNIDRWTSSPEDDDEYYIDMSHEDDYGEMEPIAFFAARMSDVTDLGEDGELILGTTNNGSSNYSVVVDRDGDLKPYTDNTSACGSSSSRWTAVYAVNGTIQTSDMRYKKDVQPMEYGLNELMQISTIKYKWNNEAFQKTETKASESGKGTHPIVIDTADHIGFNAQELLKIVPEVVVVDEEESDNLGVYYTQLIPVLVNSIKEQQAMLEDNKKEIEILKKELEGLKSTK